MTDVDTTPVSSRRRATKPKARPKRGATTATKASAPARRSAAVSAIVARTSDGAGSLAGLSLALLLGAFGFVFQPFWIGAIVVMAVLWGSLVSSRRNAGEGVGVVAELVAAAVREGHDVSDAISSR